MNIEKISNWNEKISNKELKYLEKIADWNLDFLNIQKEELNQLKDLLLSQMKKYSQRKNIPQSSKQYIKKLTSKAINQINQILNKETSEPLEKEFPTIKDTKELRKLFEQKLITIKDVEKWIKKWYKTIKVHYQNWESDRISVKELKKFYDEIIKAQKYSINSAKEGIKKSKDGKHINYKAISDYADNYDKNHPEKLSWLSKLIAKAQVYMEATEKWNDPLSRKLQNKMKKFWLDIKNDPNDNWCAAFVGQVLIESGYFKNVNDLKQHLPFPYPEIASNYLWLWKILGKDYYFKAHIWIYTGWETMINGNSHNMVRYSKVNFNKLVGWVLPQDIWNPNKVHWYRKEKNEPPVGALLVLKRWKEKLSSEVAKIAWWT